MGKGFNNYMTKKFFHPSSKENIKRVWMAEQKTQFEKKKQEDLLTQYQKEQDMYGNRALLGDEKAKMGLSFMYDAPPGMKKEKEKEEGEPEYKFEWQRKYNAPREQYAKGDEEIRDQPFGIEVRNVRCIKCRKWGHVNTDKICPLFGKDLTAEPPQPESSAASLLESMREDGFTLKQSILGKMSDPKASNEQLLPDDDEDDPEVQFLKSLTPKQKKKLLKKLNKLQKKKGDHKTDRKKKKKRKEKRHSKDSKKSKKSSRKEDSSSSDSSNGGRKQKNGSRKHSTEDSDDTSDSDSDSEDFQAKKHKRQQPQYYDDSPPSVRKNGGVGKKSSSGHKETKTDRHLDRHSESHSDKNGHGRSYRDRSEEVSHSGRASDRPVRSRDRDSEMKERDRAMKQKHREHKDRTSRETFHEKPDRRQRHRHRSDSVSPPPRRQQARSESKERRHRHRSRSKSFERMGARPKERGHVRRSQRDDGSSSDNVSARHPAGGRDRGRHSDRSHGQIRERKHRRSSS